MGGHALKKFGIESIRLNKEDYFYVQQLIINEFNSIGISLLPISAYKSKLDYGDLDLLTESGPDFRALISEFIGNNDIYVNGGTYSFGFPVDKGKFQVDIITVKQEWLDTSLHYFSYSPSGNLKGKLYHKFGANYGHDGLSYILRDNENTYQLGKLTVSTDNKKICEFLGLDFNDFYKGFENESDIFDWIISSKYFDHRIFSYENMNHIARVRDRKRPDYRRFLQYIEKYKDKTYEFPLKTDGAAILNEYFPESNLIEKLNNLKELEIKRKQLRQKFNGNLVREWTGTEGKELGRLLKEFEFSRGMFSDFPTFELFIEHSPQEKIKEKFMDWYSHYKK